MQNKRFGILAMLFIVIGIGGLLRFSNNVRLVDVLGLFASGFACGAALVSIIAAFRNKPNVEQLKQ